VCNHVWDSQVEGWKPRIYIQCIKCGKIVRDFENYVVWLTRDLDIDSVVDVGTGMKGVVARKYYEEVRGIKRGYAVDIWKIKQLSPIWTPLNIDALRLLEYLEPKSVDVVQALGFLEHLEKPDGYEFLSIAEKLARKLVIVSGAKTLHGPTPDYKVKKDGNPYHLYRSTWSWRDFEPLGWETSREHDEKGEGYGADVVAWRRLSPI